MGLSVDDVKNLVDGDDVLRVTSLKHSDNPQGGGLKIGDLGLFKCVAPSGDLWLSFSGFDFPLRISPLDVELPNITWDDLKKAVGDSVPIKESEEIEGEKHTLAPIKSDGGSSGYYFTKLPKYLIDQIVETGGIEIKDIVRYCFDNDADCKDIIKALKRINESKKGGGKDGITIDYDLKKVGFFYDEMVNAYLKTKDSEGLRNENNL